MYDREKSIRPFGWTMKPVALKTVARQHGLQHRKGYFKLIFIDRTDPVGEVWWQPFWMRHEKDNTWARFRFVDTTGDVVWFAAPYYHCVQAFVQNLGDVDFYRITRMCDAKLYSVDEREDIVAAMQKYKEIEPWLKDYRPVSKEPLEAAKVNSGSSPPLPVDSSGGSPKKTRGRKSKSPLSPQTLSPVKP